MANATLDNRSTPGKLIAGVQRAVEWWIFELGEVLRSITRMRKIRMLEFEIDDNDEPVPSTKRKQRIRGGRRHLRLQLPDNAFFYRKIKLPVAVRKNIDQVIRYEFNKYFPMDAEAALFSCSVVAPRSGAASVEIKIWAISKLLIDMHLAIIRKQYEIQVRKLALCNSSGSPLINIDIEKAERLAAARQRASTSRALNITLAGLLAALVIYPMNRMDAYLEQQQSEIDLLQKKAQPVIDTRQQIMLLDERFKELVDSKRVNPDLAYIWSYLTRALADKAILERMEINGRKVQLAGKAPSVERLIRDLETDQLIAEVKIAGQVNSIEDDKFETMNLTLTLAE